jgi:hypothetical protein
MHVNTRHSNIKPIVSRNVAMIIFLLRYQDLKHTPCNPESPPPNFGRSSFRRQVPPRPHDARGPSSERWNFLGENFPLISPTNVDFHATCRDLLHAANLRHGADGLTSPPKEGLLRISSP